MKPRRIRSSNVCLSLPGGNEDNDLWVEVARDTEGAPVFMSTWEPSEAERRLLAEGGTVSLVVWGKAHPPVAIETTAPLEVLKRGT